MTEIQKATELSIQEYVASIGLNPDHVFYQRIASNNISLNQAQWQIINANKRSLLLSYAQVHWKPTITKFRADGVTAEAFVNNGIFASLKPGLPFSNAMSNIQLTLNSASITINQPRRFTEILTMMYAGRKGAKNCFSSCGGTFPQLNSFNDNVAATRGLYTGYQTIDYDHLENEERFKEKLLRAAGVGDLQGLNNIQIDCIEPLLIPPFNPFMKLKTDMPDYVWFKDMSPMIPHVSNLEITCNFQNLSASVLMPRYLRFAANNEVKRLGISALAADLILYWYSPPINMTMPRQITLNSWSVREYITTVNNNVAVVNNAAVNGVQTDLLQLHSVPTLIIIHAEVDKDGAQYVNTAIHADTDQAGNAAQVSATNNALDSYMEISELQVLLGDRPQVISTTFTQEELYYLTLKNSKIDDFPYDFNKWRGQFLAAPTAAAATYNQMSRCFIALRPKDLSEKFGDGVKFPTSLQFQMVLTARDGIQNIAGGNKIYRLYVHVFSGKHFLTLTPDAGQFQEQQISLEAVIRSTQGAGGPSGGNVVIDDQRYVSRMPQI